MRKHELTEVWGIYKITNKINGKFYIGSSNNLRKRLQDHKRELRAGKHTNKHLQASWNKYGEDSFDFEVLEIVSDGTNEKLRELETLYIQETECYKGSIGYNLIPGGIGTLNLHCSEEKKKRISEANKGKVAWNKGIPMDETQKDTLKEINRKNRGKKIDISDPQGNFIETLSSVSEVVEKYQISKNTVTDSCKGRRVPRKFIFKYNGNYIKTSKEYKKNVTYCECKFCIYDLNQNLLYECKYKKDVIKYITGSDKRNGAIERALKECPTVIHKTFIVKFENALSSGDITNESRQPNKDDVRGIVVDNYANGEA